MKKVVVNVDYQTGYSYSLECHEGKDFDPEFHEAVMQVQSDKHASGQIVDVLSKGFMIKDRVLRPAKVSVAN